MKSLTRIAVLLVLGISCTYGQDEDLLGLPVEFDIFGLDVDDTFYKEAPQQPSNTEDLLRKLCDEYDLQLNNKPLDCQNIRLVPKEPKPADHSIQKREAEEPPLEGSGEPDDVIPLNEEAPQEPPVEENKVDETDTAQQEPNTDEEQKFEPAVPYAEETENAAPEPSTNVEGENPDAPQEEPKQESPSESQDAKEAEGSDATQAQEQVPPVEAPTEEEATNNVVQPEQEPSLGPQEQQEAEQPPNLPDPSEEDKAAESDVAQQPSEAPNKEDAANSENQAPEGAEAPTENPVAPTTIVPGQEESTTKFVKKGRLLKPEEVKEPGHTNPEEGTEEKVHEYQSGNAIIEAKGTDTLQGTDAVMKRLPNNADLTKSDSPNDETKTGSIGQSTESTQEGRKDSKVLIILLVAVVVIGAAAFAYNFIKKRKQKKQDTSRTENGNSTAPAKDAKDAELGTELKPLMRPDQKPVVEYKDENAKEEVAAN